MIPAIKIATEVDSNDETTFPHKSLLTYRQVSKLSRIILNIAIKTISWYNLCTNTKSWTIFNGRCT